LIDKGRECENGEMFFYEKTRAAERESSQSWLLITQAALGKLAREKRPKTEQHPLPLIKWQWN